MDLVNMTDEELVKIAKGGTEQALDILLNRHKTLASKIARSYFLAGAEQEDLMQEAMIGLYKAYISFQQSQNATFQTFATLCITRNIQSAVKQANRKKNQALNSSLKLTSQGEVLTGYDDNEAEITIVIPSSDLSPDDVLIEEERICEIKKQIKTALSEFEQKVLTEYLKGESYIQIANKLNITTKSVDNALSRIKNKLWFLKK